MAKSLTSGNSVLWLTIAGLYDTPVPLQGFTAEDIFDTENVASNEVVMGLDGYMSAGYVPQPIPMNISLQADSDSVVVFEQWYEKERQSRETLFASLTVAVPAVQRQYNCRKGALTGHNVTPSAKRTLQARRFTITWENISASDL